MALRTVSSIVSCRSAANRVTRACVSLLIRIVVLSAIVPTVRRVDNSVYTGWGSPGQGRACGRVPPLPRPEGRAWREVLLNGCEVCVALPELALPVVVTRDGVENVIDGAETKSSFVPLGQLVGDGANHRLGALILPAGDDHLGELRVTPRAVGVPDERSQVRWARSWLYQNCRFFRCETSSAAAPTRQAPPSCVAFAYFSRVRLPSGGMFRPLARFSWYLVSMPMKPLDSSGSTYSTKASKAEPPSGSPPRSSAVGAYSNQIREMDVARGA
jgi:hypothetical protein